MEGCSDQVERPNKIVKISTILEVQGLSKSYRSGDGVLTVLNDLSFTVEKGSTCAIVGPSGSGQTTRLGLCGALDRPSPGTVVLDGIELGSMGEDELAKIRNQYIGFIFQTFQLIPTLTALENVMVPLEIQKHPSPEGPARDLLARVGLACRTSHYPSQLSGGEQQRVALARAYNHRPSFLLADAPPPTAEDLEWPWRWRTEEPAALHLADELLEVRLQLGQAVAGHRDAAGDDLLELGRRLGVEHLRRAVAVEER